MKIHKGQKGFTLVELIFVIAIILVLAGIFLPLAVNKLEEADNARANSDTNAIAAALTSFLSDLRAFPACDGADCDPLSSSVNQMSFLAFGDGSGDLSANYPSDNSALTAGAGAWDLTTQDEATPARNNAFNHLIQNDPDADGGTDGSDYSASGKRAWKGPYLAKASEDPYGQTYLAHIGAIAKSGSPIQASSQGWILSAGPDKEIDTGVTAKTLGDDDIGFIYFSR